MLSDKSILAAHNAITRVKGKDYAPSAEEIQEWVDQNVCVVCGDPKLFAETLALENHRLRSEIIRLRQAMSAPQLEFEARIKECHEQRARELGRVSFDMTTLTRKYNEALAALELSQKHMQKSGINYDNAEVWNAITKAINKTKGGSNG